MSPVVLVSLGALDAALIAQGLYGVSKYRSPSEREAAKPKKERWPITPDD
jgi:hypothetical protein